MFNAFEALFSPGRKHTEDENRRLELTREQLGDADPGRGPIDLGSGKVTVTVTAGQGPRTASVAAADTEEDGAAEPGDGAGPQAPPPPSATTDPGAWKL
ncbi:DUF6191 domain-containing protein [Streptomyces sp. NPDC049954]|uniref:DUF6191 domain-containing protein n=1 Tax=Streptomyces sp. NPDC049954 TaxID=3155779 RepID=UPI00343E9883